MVYSFSSVVSAVDVCNTSSKSVSSMVVASSSPSFAEASHVFNAMTASSNSTGDFNGGGQASLSLSLFGSAGREVVTSPSLSLDWLSFHFFFIAKRDANPGEFSVPNKGLYIQCLVLDLQCP